MGLERSDERVTDLVIGDNELFLVGQNLIFLLVASNDNLNALFEVGLGNLVAACTDSAQCSFVYHVCKLCTGCTGSHARDGIEVQTGFALDLLGMYTQDGFTTDQVRQLNGYTAVETTGTQQRGVKGFGTVGCSQNDNTLAAIETIHLGQQLV